MNIFVTGTAGFVGYHLAQRLLADGHAVIGCDAITDYYGAALKRARHARLAEHASFRPVIARLEDAAALRAAIGAAQPEIVLHLAAQAGVRYSLDHAPEYVSSNLMGTLNLLEAAAAVKPRHLLFASSSSVYGGNPGQPFAETDRTAFPLSVYAATKAGAEALTHSYAHLHKLPTTGFRFFTVYGPWGRPDMALFKFVDAIEKGQAIDLYGGGNMKRDFTYVGDLVEAVVRLMDEPPVVGAPVAQTDSLSPVAPWRVVNIAPGQPTGLLDFVAAIERAVGKKAIRAVMPMQPGDVAETNADPALLRALIGDMPHTSIDAGVAAFVDWYRKEWPSVQT